MRPKLTRLLLGLVLVMLAGWAEAAATYTCSLGAPTAFSDSYSASSNSPVALTVVVSCAKSPGGGTGTFNLASVAPTNNGLNNSGSQNRGVNAGTYISYDLYTDATCGTLWTGSGALSFTYTAGGAQTMTSTVTYYGCVPSAQTLLPAAGTFTDTGSLTLSAIAPAVLGGTNPQTFAVSISVPSICTLPSTISNLAFGTYTAFGSALTASTNFGMTCNQNLPIISLDVGTSGGVLATDSLYYTMAINTTNSGGSNPLNGLTGTGTAVTYYINGTMPAGQAGVCAAASCAAQSETRTLTVTY